MWDKRYGAEEYAYGTEPNDFLVEVADRLPMGRILCLAEGEGRNAVWLAQHGYKVTAVDASAVGCRKAELLAQERGVEITVINADLAEFRIEPGVWDGIVKIFGHLPPALRREVHEGCVAGLKPGGRMVLEAYTRDQLQRDTGGPPVAELMMDAESLRDELKGLDFEILQETVRDVQEGRHHDGPGAVVQMLAVQPGP
ncbi:methyltransferase family protein [Aliiruegeria haliotis]|uniref:Methyltransferase family protein n=1 Tax=Aliiruegeria haliotis TaxID=1280846 RepID=A0A2T0RV88_9RHOB|nr:class I SAM-dependent methyltransferase [Aliiruegeria haliotis]PRY25067.1 methyltransferase family protein [Aliiruegeria haliotis]